MREVFGLCPTSESILFSRFACLLSALVFSSSFLFLAWRLFLGVVASGEGCLVLEWTQYFPFLVLNFMSFFE